MRNYDVPFVSVLQARLNRIFRAGASAFANVADLFVRRFAKREDRFLEIDRFILCCQPSASLVSRRPAADVWRGAALQLDVCETHREISVLRIISEQPAIEMLVHHRGRNCEMQRRPARQLSELRSLYGVRIQLPLDRRRVIDNLQMRAAGEQSKVARMLWRWRMMQEFSRITFHDSINIVHAKLAFDRPEAGSLAVRL